MGIQTTQNVSFVLLAEFHIKGGSILPYQYPFPTGTDDQLLAELMIPDGAHDHSEDWTYFFLNQSPANTIAPVFSDAESNDEHMQDESDPSLLYVINLVMTKTGADAPGAERGALVKALAICTRHPFINVFRHALIKTLNEFFNNPSVEVLAGLYDAINTMDLSNMPQLSRNEKLILRASEREDLFVEKYTDSRQAYSELEHTAYGSGSVAVTGLDEPLPNQAKFDLIERAPSPSLRPHSPTRSDRSGSASVSSGHSSPIDGEPWKRHEFDDETEVPNGKLAQEIETEDGFTLVESTTSAGQPRAPSQNDGTSSRTAFDQQSRSSSKATRSTRHRRQGSSTTQAPSSASDPGHPPPARSYELDTHFYPSSIIWRKIDEETGKENILAQIDVSIPTCTFSEEVGDYSLSRLVHLFSLPTATVTGPQHPHLHSNGSFTHPLIILFNALVTQKRIIFLGYGRPAHHVARYVLAACAFGSGCGSVLRGFTRRAFPYTNLTNHSVMMSVPGFIAGVTNPIYEGTPGWDILCYIDSGKIQVNKDIQSPAANASLFPQPPSSLPRQNSTSAVSSDQDKIAITNGASNRADNYDASFVEELQGLTEPLLRARVTEFVQRFVQLAARYEEENFGATAISYPSTPPGDMQLGSGVVLDDHKELSLCIGRIEGWRRSVSYELCKADFQAHFEECSIRGFDLTHQILRLKTGRLIADQEVFMIIHGLVQNSRTYEQVVELLALLPMHNGGLMPITFSLFHPNSTIRDCTVDLLSMIRSYHIGVQYLQNLNYFHRMAYVRLALARESLTGNSPSSTNTVLSNDGLQKPGAPSQISRSSSNLSSTSLS